MSEVKVTHAPSSTTAEFAARQWKQAKGPQPVIECECDRSIPIRFMFRCLYCGIWLCQSCAEIHFGKTRDQYNAERVKP